MDVSSATALSLLPAGQCVAGPCFNVSLTTTTTAGDTTHKPSLGHTQMYDKSVPRDENIQSVLILTSFRLSPQLGTPLILTSFKTSLHSSELRSTTSLAATEDD